MPQFAKQRDGLQPPEGLLNELALSMTEPIPDVPGRARRWRRGRTEFVLGDVRRMCIRRTAATQARVAYAFVGGHREPPRRQRQLAKHDHGGVAFGRPAGRLDRRVDDQSVTILGQQMREIPEFRFEPGGFLVEPGIGIGRRLVRVVPPGLPTEIHGRILRIVWRAVAPPFGLRSL